MVRWRKFDLGTSSFDVFATYVKITGSSAAYHQPNAPRIVVDRSTGNVSATLQFKNVKLEDAGIYKVEVSVGWFPGPVTIADQEFYFIVLGKGCTLHKFEMSLLIIITGHSFMHILHSDKNFKTSKIANYKLWLLLSYSFFHAPYCQKKAKCTLAL